MSEPLTRAELREELQPLNEKLERALVTQARHEERLRTVERHPQECPVKEIVVDLKAQNGKQDTEIMGIKTSHALMLGKLAGAGAAGGLLAGLVLKLIGA